MTKIFCVGPLQNSFKQTLPTFRFNKIIQSTSIPTNKLNLIRFFSKTKQFNTFWDAIYKHIDIKYHHHST